MTYDVAHFWVALLVAFALGGGCGWSTRPTLPAFGPDAGLARVGAYAGALLVVVGLALALLRAVPGRPGLMLETALLMSVAYALGFGLTVLAVTWRTPVTDAAQGAADLDKNRRRGADGKSFTATMPSRWLMVIAAAIASFAALFLAIYVRRKRAPSGRGAVDRSA